MNRAFFQVSSSRDGASKVRQVLGCPSPLALSELSDATKAGRGLCTLYGSPIPTGLRHEAQRCEERATLEKGEQ